MAAYASLPSTDRSALRWLRADEPLRFRLMAGDSLVADLAWEKDAGSLALAESAEGSWALQRGGFLNPHVVVRPKEEGREIARLSVHLGYHLIHLADGRSYRFHRAGLLVPAWQVTTEDRREILHLEPVRAGRALEGGAVVVDPTAKDLKDLLLLVVLTWHFIVIAWFEDEALVPLEGRDLPS